MKRNRWTKSDVVQFLKLHIDTAREKTTGDGGNVTIELDGKRRPMMVTAYLPNGNYECFSLTTVKPRQDAYFLKGPDGKAQVLQKNLGLKNPSYLLLRPMEKVRDDSKARRLTKFPEELYRAALIQYTDQLIGNHR